MDLFFLAIWEREMGSWLQTLGQTFFYTKQMGEPFQHQAFHTQYGNIQIKWCYSIYLLLFAVCAGFRLNNAWANGTVLRPFLQPESPLSSRSLVSGFKCKLRDSNSRPPYSMPQALTTRLYTIQYVLYWLYIKQCASSFNKSWIWPN